MTLRSIAFVLGLLILPALPAVGQPVATGRVDGQLAEDVQGIRRTLDRLVGLLETARHHRQVDLLLKRIELRERRLEPLEGRLSSAEAELQRTEEYLQTLERMRDQHEELLNQEIRDGADAPRSDTRRTLEEIRRSWTGAEERLEAARMRVQRYENELTDGRRDIEILDEMLLELLEAERP
jgi:predicted  nucleic acid-binding Zn-ribbon protein